MKFGTAEVQAWLPGDDASRKAYGRFLEQFGDDQVLFVSWPGCKLTDPRLGKLSSHISTLAAARPELGITHVEDSAGIYRRLIETPGGISADVARERLTGWAIGPDGTCSIALRVSDATNAERAMLVESLRVAAWTEIAVEESELVLAGEPFQVYLIDQASRQTIERFVVPSSLLALFIAWICLGSWRVTCVVFVLAGLGQLLGLALISVFLGEMSAVLVVLPTLIFMLTLSAAIHLANYYRDCGGDKSRLAGAATLAHGALPCGLATLTTVFGFGSLIVSQLTPVWQFGSLAGLGLLISTLILLAVFPAAISLGLRPQDEPLSVAQLQRATPLIDFLSKWTGKYAIAITAMGLLLLLGSAAGLGRLKTSTEFEDMFAADSSAIRSLRWVQEHLGPINALEFVVAIPHVTAATSSAGDASNSDDLLGNAELIQKIHRVLASSQHVSSVMSASTFLPAIPDGVGTRNTIRRSVLRRSLEMHLGDMQVANLPSVQAWRLSARIHNLGAENYREIQTQLRTLIESFIDADKTARGLLVATGQPVTVSITGLRSVIERAHFALLSDLGGSFVTAFVLIAPVMMLIVRGVGSGLLLMIPNLLPVVLVFGSMGWLGIKLDVASILTASVALGIAVDDTLHFMTWFIRSRRLGHSSTDAVRDAMAGCARPMLHTSVICTGSMLPFFFSDFLPTSKFALLMILILSGAILGDLILLPAILQSPLGRLVGKAGQGKRGSVEELR